MVTSTSPSPADRIGRVFTPSHWAKWLVLKWGIFGKWVNGASICDPTAGQGIFALVLLGIAKERGVQVTPDMLARLTLIDLDSSNLETFWNAAARSYNVSFPPSNLLVRDVITETPNAKFDILVGNPPWANFTELPPHYKEKLKPLFVEHGLVEDKRKVLLGSSRVDIAALVLKVALGKLLQKRGFACFYVPLSLFAGDDAHAGFRKYRANNRRFAVSAVYEFTRTKVFPGISTSYCCARFKMDTTQRFPVKYFRENDNSWVKYQAAPFNRPNDQWRVLPLGETFDTPKPVLVQLRPEQKPRQGVNTCGANRFFIFDERPSHLPANYVFPLITNDLWKSPALVPVKWILLPYDDTLATPLEWSVIQRNSKLKDYLLDGKEQLTSRKGSLIRSAISRGYWWSLLGVGAYSFAPFKVVWQAYGNDQFLPRIVGKYHGKAWQGNQAMHAFIPCWNKAEAERICASLRDPSIVLLLKQMNGAGKCNWAQPGKMKKILELAQPQHARHPDSSAL